ncbi:MAG: zinc-binding dehydrogenase [Phycisphaerales bacterium]|jgi:NADPH:quinone reductase-like Zn-dependent oxidoreductase|nr:zinc-binding dehydrogenase [Phycisphaerales bacterium]MDP6890004.1 zinc-binding dehydrogenase [Phycisphaerales bacterium]
MRALCVTRQGDPVTPNIELLDLPEPKPTRGELLVATEASALNHLDLWVGRGLPGIDTQYPHIGGSDGCGRVVGVGAGVDEAWMDQRVMFNFAVEIPHESRPNTSPAGREIYMIGEHTPGTHAERFTAPASNAVAVGEAVDSVQAAAYGLTHLTAWGMLRTKARLHAGDTVLITGIGGGVALAALNIANHFGCRTIVTSRHQWKLDKALELGATDAVLDEGEDWSRAVRSLTGLRGVDICADSIGAAVHTSCLKSLARGGRFVACGCTSGAHPKTDLSRLFWNQLQVLGSTMGDMNEFRQAVALFTGGHLQPVIDSVVPAEDGRTAFGRIESGAQFGKVAVVWS